jgi:hypothetical protein
MPTPRQGRASDRIELSIRRQTVHEELRYIRRLAAKEHRYRELRYRIEFPQSQAFLELLAKAGRDGRLTDDRQANKRMEELFRNEVYDPTAYAAGLRKIEASRERLESLLCRLRKLDPILGFRVLSHYHVFLTLYGMGGSYESDTGRIVTKIRPDGNYVRHDPAEVVLHEAVHLGIEHSIVRRFGLSHAEKEAVVDGICMVVFGDALPGYKASTKANQELCRAIAEAPLGRLPEVVAAHVQRRGSQSETPGKDRV